MTSSSEVDVESPAALALRALQMADQVAPAVPVENREGLMAAALARVYLNQAQDELGRLLGLTCTGEEEQVAGGVAYNHGHLPGAWQTCPIHEWLVPDDCAVADRELEGRTAPR